jgi:hypothetical protein
MTDLVVSPCSRKAAEHAVLRWHYSAQMPTGKLVTFGVWEDGDYVGAILYGRGASPYLLTAYGLDQTEGCELVRVALRRHTTPVSQAVASTLRQLRDVAPGLRVVVSFADPKEGHHGGIYQAGNWVYTGMSNPVTEYLIGGRWRHTRGAYWNAKGREIPKRTAPGKHRYVYPLDRQMRRRLSKLALPYPQPADEGSTVSRPASGR